MYSFILRFVPNTSEKLTREDMSESRQVMFHHFCMRWF